MTMNIPSGQHQRMKCLHVMKFKLETEKLATVACSCLPRRDAGDSSDKYII